MSALQKIEVAPGIFLSAPLVSYWPMIASTRRPFIRITATPALGLRLGQSSFGHLPRMPKGYPYPKDTEGNFMYPLAQINFSEVPPLAPFPASGFLQFYISPEDSFYGMDLGDLSRQEGFRVLFFEEEAVSVPETDFSFLSFSREDLMTPLDEPHALSFQVAEGFLGPEDVALGEHFTFKEAMLRDHPDTYDDLVDELAAVFHAHGHRLGGYAHFTQTDPRPVPGELMLLMQMDTDAAIMWGDAGVGHFFIPPADLERRDFSRVFYHWDCA